MESEFFIYDIEYNEKKEGIDLYCKLKNGEKRIFFKKFYPKIIFAWENEEGKRKILNELNEYEGIVSKEIKKKKLLGKEIEIVEVKCKNRKVLSKLSEMDIEGVKKYEFDVGLKKQFLKDNNINFFIWYKGEVKNGEIGEVEKVREVRLNEIKVIAFDIEVYNYRGNPRVDKDQIILISVYGDNIQKVILSKEVSKKEVVAVKNELELLRKFEEIINKEKPDVILSYNGDNFDLPYIRERAKKYRYEIRFLGDKIIYRRKGRERACRLGKILHVDLYRFIANILASSLQSETLSLNEVAKELIGEEKIKIEKYEMWKMFEHKEKLDLLVEYNLNDAKITFLLGKKLLPLIIELSRLVKISPFDASRSSYSMLVENYLIEKTSKFNEIIPRRPKEEEVMKRLFKTYEGAFVFQPSPGLYKDIVAFDFRSLYPSIIISKNICLTTIDKGCKEEDRIYEPEKRHYFCKNIKGFIPTVLKEIAEKRFALKDKLKKLNKDNEEYKEIYNKQYTLKIIMNSTYGYLGFARARWYCIEAAMSITSFGRYYIKKIINEFDNAGFRVIYGDTDSVFILLNGKKLKDAKEIAKKINEKEEILLEFQGYYKAGLFVAKKESKKGAKKKYALLDEKGNLIIKGFEYVRRDWCELAKEMQRKVLEIILRESNIKKAKEEVSKIIKALKEKKVDVKKLVIYTQITRNLEEYEVKKAPHIAAAKKALKKGYHIEPGMIIAYVITKRPGSISDKAEILEEVIKNKIDYDEEYYINNQILPAVKRIFDSLKVSVDEIEKGQKTLFSFSSKKN